MNHVVQTIPSYWHTAALLVVVIGLGQTRLAAEPAAVGYTTRISHHFPCPEESYWFQARATAIPGKLVGDSAGDGPRVLLTMQPHGMMGTHNYKGIVSAISDDLGKTWQGPTHHEALDLREEGGEEGQFYEVPVDGTPLYHPATGKVLLLGATFHVDKKTNKDVPKGPSDVFYAVYDPKTNQWDAWQILAFPSSFKWPYKRAGCVQCVVESNGDLLLPFYFGEHNNSIHYAAVARCTFDGTTLKYLEHGTELMVPTGRGMNEPSLARFEGRYFLTMRNDNTAYVSTSDNGIDFDSPELWKFDNGEEIGSYNTQQHFVTHSDALFLVYTRRGLDNDDVMRHRAPLVMAQVDPVTCRLLRKTEQIVVPKEGDAAMGNFGVCDIGPKSTWIVVAKRSKTPGEKNVVISQIEWDRPNRLVQE